MKTSECRSAKLIDLTAADALEVKIKQNTIPNDSDACYDGGTPFLGYLVTE